MSVELRPCPFCGCEMNFKRDSSGWNKIIGMHGDNCPLEGNNFLTWSSTEDAQIIKKFNTRADGWISVDVHGIEWHCLVAVPLDNDEFYINTVSVGEEGDLFDMDGSYIGYHASQVSHWMPLPNPPKVR